MQQGPVTPLDATTPIFCVHNSGRGKGEAQAVPLLGAAE
jgi:hypothetical protein